MWTSPNRYALLGLHAHYLDASYKVQSRLRALRRVWDLIPETTKQRQYTASSSSTGYATGLAPVERFSGEKMLTRLNEKPSQRRPSKLKSVNFDFGENGAPSASCTTSFDSLGLLRNGES
ncbi:hypothetical protein VCV18_012709 [Metarhizium anisopliae]